MNEKEKKQYPKLDPVPKTCSECIKSKYKLPKPQCIHEQGLEHKKAYTYFKTIYSIPIPQHLDIMQRIKRQREVCLRQIQEEATKMLTLRRALDIDSILSRIGSLNDRIDDIEDNDHYIPQIEDKDRILASPHEQKPGETITKNIVKPIEQKPSKPKEDKSTSLKDRGWLMYVRNLKKNKIESYVKKLKEEHADLPDKQIKITLNKSGNYMIRYTLNQNLTE